MRRYFYQVLVLFLSLSLCRLSHAATQTCWYKTKISTKSTFVDNNARNQAIKSYEQCNQNHIKSFWDIIKKLEKKKASEQTREPECEKLYNELILTDIYWLTRTFVGDVSTDKSIAEYRKKRTLREDVVTQLNRFCSAESVELGRSRQHIDYYSEALLNPYSMMISLSPCMNYRLAKNYLAKLPLDKKYKFGHADYYKNLLRNDWPKIFDNKNKGTNNDLTHQVLYHLLDRPFWQLDKKTLDLNEFKELCAGDNFDGKEYNNTAQGNIYKNPSSPVLSKLYSVLYDLEEEIFQPKGIIFERPNRDPELSIYYPYPDEYNPGFYPYMPSLGECSKSKIFTRLGIYPPELINCTKVRQIMQNFSAASPYSSCSNEKCLAESSREQTIWIALRELKLILNEKSSYNCKL